MIKKLAKIKYLPNTFQILEDGDYVECAVSGKKIELENWHTGALSYKNLITHIRKLFKKENY